MVKVYVTELPNEPAECPFYVANSKKCNVSKNKCCMAEGEKCKNLLDMRIEFEEVIVDGIPED